MTDQDHAGLSAEDVAAILEAEASWIAHRRAGGQVEFADFLASRGLSLPVDQVAQVEKRARRASQPPA